MKRGSGNKWNCYRMEKIRKRLKEEGYKYLGILEADKIKKGHQEQFCKEHHRRAKSPLNSNLKMEHSRAQRLTCA